MNASTWQLPETAHGWVTDGGLETDLIFHRGMDLPDFASFPLLDDPGRPRGARRLLPRVRRRGGAGRCRAAPRDPDLAGEHRLGCAARVRRRRTAAGQPGRGRAPARPRRGGARRGRAGAGRRRRRSARRRLPRRRPRRGPLRRLPPAAARRLRGGGRGPRDGVHPDDGRRGGRDRAGGPGRGAAGGDLLHRRDRRPAARRHRARRCDRAARRGDRGRRRPPAGELRAPRPRLARIDGGAAWAAASQGCG